MDKDHLLVTLQYRRKKEYGYHHERWIVERSMFADKIESVWKKYSDGNYDEFHFSPVVINTLEITEADAILLKPQCESY